MRRREFLVLFAGAMSVPRVALGQPVQRRPLVGWLVFGGANLGSIDQAMVDELAKRGLVEGRNIDVAFRYANDSPDRLSPLAHELVALNPNILIAIGGDVVMALFGATRQIPIVGGVSDNPVRAGFTTGFSRPDQNFTGVSFITDEMAAKRLELLKEVFPSAKRVAVIWNPQHLDDEITFARRAAQTLGIELLSFEARDSMGSDRALSDAANSTSDSLFVIPSRLTSANAAKIGSFARDRKLPVITAWREFADVGCLLSYGPSRRYQISHFGRLC